jgi:hypothetical protein
MLAIDTGMAPLNWLCEKFIKINISSCPLWHLVFLTGLLRSCVNGADLLLIGVPSPPSAVPAILSWRRRPWLLASAWIQDRQRHPRRSPMRPSPPRGFESGA